MGDATRTLLPDKGVGCCHMRMAAIVGLLPHVQPLARFSLIWQLTPYSGNSHPYYGSTCSRRRARSKLSSAFWTSAWCAIASSCSFWKAGFTSLISRVPPAI